MTTFLEDTTDGGKVDYLHREGRIPKVFYERNYVVVLRPERLGSTRSLVNRRGRWYQGERSLIHGLTNLRVYQCLQSKKDQNGIQTISGGDRAGRSITSFSIFSPDYADSQRAVVGHSGCRPGPGGFSCMKGVGALRIPNLFASLRPIDQNSSGGGGSSEISGGGKVRF